MIVVIDTNALLPALSTTHPYREILEAWMHGAFALAVTTEMLLEYEEIAKPRIGTLRWQQFISLLDRVGSLRHNVLAVSPAYRFHLVTNDPDDDKFADCAVTANADYIITSDGDFDALSGSGYKPRPVTPEEFIRRHLSSA